MPAQHYSFQRYNSCVRQDVSAALEPVYSFQRQRGAWGISGIVRFGRGSNYVFFVSFGQGLPLRRLLGSAALFLHGPSRRDQRSPTSLCRGSRRLQEMRTRNERQLTIACTSSIIPAPKARRDAEEVPMNSVAGEAPGQSPFISLGSFWRISPSTNPALRIGLLLDSVNMSRFFATIIEDIRASNFADLELLIFRRAPSLERPANQTRSIFSKVARRLTDPNLRKHVLYEQYLRLDERVKPRNHPLDLIDCSPLLKGTEAIEVEPVGKKFVHRFPREAVSIIQAKKLDVLLRFGFNILHGDILSSARYGVWSYHHGDNEFYRGGPSHFWELCENAPLSGVVLQVLSEDLDAGLTLCKALFATEATISVSRNRYPAYWGSTDFVVRKLNELHQFGWNYLLERSLPQVPYKGKREIYRTPTNVEIARWLGPIVCKKAVRRLFPQVTIQHWRIAVRTTGQLLFEQAKQGDLSGFRWLEPPAGYFWADPFVIEHDNRSWAFFEEYSYKDKRAHISCAEISPEGSFISPTPCLVDAHRHYSYPDIFCAGGDLFMIPETSDVGSVDLYRCEHFPDRWVRETTLLRGRFVDTTVWQNDELWWLLTTTATPDSRSGCLLLFYADSVSGPWHFHPANPISTDVRNVRNWSGKVELIDGQTTTPLKRVSPNQSVTPSNMLFSHEASDKQFPKSTAL